ncbi:MAG: PLP-dependent aminotransferase family protein [Dehalococcoidia bacterium]
MSDRSATSSRASGSSWSADDLGALLSARSRAVSTGAWTSPAVPGAISLVVGSPDPTSAAAAEILEATRIVLAREAAEALDYGGNYGHPGLRELVASRIDHQPGLGYTGANVELTNGGAQGLENIFTTFLDPGDTVVAESPVWGGALRTLRSMQIKVEPVPLDEGGIIIAELEDTLGRLAAEGRRPKLIYTIPTFQNPMGISATLDRRKQLIEVAARHRVLLLEDDPYGEVRFAGSPLPSLLTLAGGEGVVRCSSFSKIIATGLRVGWVIGRKDFVDACAKMRFDNGTSQFTSRIINAYIEAGFHEPHMDRICRAYRAKYDAMHSALEESVGNRATWTRPEGGFFIWLTLPDRIDPAALARAADEEGVQYVPGRSFTVDGSCGNSIRLAYSFETEERIAEAVRRLARAIDRVS